MLACNVFGKTAAANTPGVGPNSLAMLGEIIATQTGAARRHDAAVLEALGLGGGGEEIPVSRGSSRSGGSRARNASSSATGRRRRRSAGSAAGSPPWS